MPKGDQWELVDNDKNSVKYKKSFKFDFCFIESDDIKKVVKAYVWRNYREKNKTLRYMLSNLSKLKKFNKFAILNEIFAFKELTNNDIEMFISYLKTIISKQTKKPLSYNTQRSYLNSIKSIVRWGQTYLPNEMPNKEIFTGNEFTGVNKNIKTEFIPDKIIENINSALKKEDNIYIKYGIVIIQTTGMRLSDMLKLEVDSLKKHLISGWNLSWYDHKNRKKQDKIPVPNGCAIAIHNLIEKTENIRQETDKSIQNNIFIHKPSVGKKAGEINNISIQTYSFWLKKFIKRHNIKDKNGELYNLTAHKFRRTLATDMYSKGANLLVIRDILGHSYTSTTSKHYADVKDKDRAESFKKIGVIGDINNVDEVLEDKEKLEWFKENKNKGARMCDGYCVKPFKDGEICDRLEKKKKCFTCKYYITTPEYLESHKKHLKDLQKQLDNNVYGQHYADHIKPTIEILKEIIARLEEL